MINYYTYRKLSTLKNGKKILLRFLNGKDRECLVKLFQDAYQEDIEFCKEDLKNPQVVDQWLNPGNSGKILSIVAIDLETNGPIAAVILYRGQQAALKVGEIQQIFVSRPFQGLGLGSLMLDELLDLASQENIHWLKAEVPIEQKHVIRSFLARDFEIRATLEDFFISKKGIPSDVALMMCPLINKEGDNL
jgi:GNAT superfamily N-acetyltransferase